MAYELIETVEVGAGGASSIEFTSIPQDGVDLVVKSSARTSGTGLNHVLQFNNDTGVNYSGVYLGSFNATVQSGSGGGGATQDTFAPTSEFTANTFGSTEFYISNYTSTSDKSISADSVTEQNGTTPQFMSLAANTYTTTSPITSIKVGLQQNGDLVEGTIVSLYKIS